VILLQFLSHGQLILQVLLLLKVEAEGAVGVQQDLLVLEAGPLVVGFPWAVHIPL